MKLGILNVALRVNISVCVSCMLGDTLRRIDYQTVCFIEVCKNKTSLARIEKYRNDTCERVNVNAVVDRS